MGRSWVFVCLVPWVCRVLCSNIVNFCNGKGLLRFRQLLARFAQEGEELLHSIVDKMWQSHHWGRSFTFEWYQKLQYDPFSRKRHGIRFLVGFVPVGIPLKQEAYCYTLKKIQNCRGGMRVPGSQPIAWKCQIQHWISIICKHSSTLNKCCNRRSSYLESRMYIFILEKCDFLHD